MNKSKIAWILICSVLFSGATASIAQTGIASHYNDKIVACPGYHGTSGMTAAHKTFPCGTKVHVTNKRNGRSVDVTITDRGPFVRGRIIDLSHSAAKQLGMFATGTAPVVVAKCE